MQPNGIILGIVAGLMAVAGFLVAAFLCLLSLLLLVNFRFANPWHLFVFAFTWSSLVVPPISYIAHLRSFTWRSLVISLVMSSSPAIAFLLWDVPASRGLTH